MLRIDINSKGEWHHISPINTSQRKMKVVGKRLNRNGKMSSHKGNLLDQSYYLKHEETGNESGVSE